MNIHTRYLDRLLVHYCDSFSIYVPFKVNETSYPAYGFFSSHIEKYVLTREANLWSSDSFEHILFLEKDQFCEIDFNEIDYLVKEYMEPVLVRKGMKNPEKNHMYSYLTILIVSERELNKQEIKKIKRYSFDKGYNFNLRGYAQARLGVVSLPNKEIYLNRAAVKMKKVLKATFQDLEQNKAGFLQLIEDGSVVPFTQE